MTPERWRQIETLYHEARERPPTERSAFLAIACAEDLELRQHIEHLLSQPGSDEGFLAGRPPSLPDEPRPAHEPLTGRTVGVYRVQALIGAGGMGEVYRAHDTRLGRAVAIKVLPRAFTSDPMRLARFDREARTLASLNHPNICAIYGFEEADRARYLVLELVDGDTLAERLAARRKRPDEPGLPLRETLNIARQIARAVAFAHEAGIIHRDLKPANVKITADDNVKVLDFGLAKAMSGDGVGTDLKQPARVSGVRTIEGTIVGTPAYMSPEQAQGRAVDVRTDIWAFGCIVYEMLAGRAAFTGDTITATIAKVLEREPDWAALPSTTPEPIRLLLRGCLAKSAKERFRDIGDVRIALDSIVSAPADTTPTAAAHRPKRGVSWLPWSLAASLALGLGLSMWSQPTSQPPSTRPMALWAEFPDTQVLDPSGGAHISAVSHDGTQIVYVASRLLYRRVLTEEEARLIPGEGLIGAREPIFSPTDQEIAFWSFKDRKIKRIPLAGSGPPQNICAEEMDSPSGMDWHRNGIVLIGQGRNGIWRGQASGGECVRVVRVGPDEEAHGPYLLPDGDHFLFTVGTGTTRDRWDQGKIFVQSLKHPLDPPIRLDITGSDARYVPRIGHIVFADRDTVQAVRFDVERLKVQGTPVIVEDEVSRAAGAVTGAANFSVSDDGTFISIPGPSPAARMEVSLADPQTEDVTRFSRLEADSYDSVRMSPDESQLAFGRGSDKKWTIYTYATNNQESIQRLTRDDSNNRYPAWRSNSRALAFQSDRENDLGIWLQEIGPNKPVRLTRAADGESHIPESWFRDTLVFSITVKGRASLYWISVPSLLDGTLPEKHPFGSSISSDPMSAVFSHDGKLVAYTMTEGVTPRVCVEPFPQGKRDCYAGEPTDTPKHPQWSPTDERLYFDPRITFFGSVRVVRLPSEAGTPQRVQLVEARKEEFHPFRLSPPGTRTPYDITRTGKFVGLTTPGKKGYERPLQNKIQVVQNWFERVKQAVEKQAVQK